MKKILLAISAMSAALFSTAANADISVGGSMKAVYVDAEGNADAHIGGAISFSMSTTTDGGVTISAGGSISNDNDATGNNTAATGLTALTFGFANGSITIADDVAVPAGTGLVGELVTHADVNMPSHTNDVALGTDDGSGVSGSTTLGDMTIAATYVYDGAHAQNIDGGTTTGQGASLTVPLGDMSLVVSTSQIDAAGGSAVFRNAITDVGSTAFHFVNSVNNGSYRIRFDSDDTVVGSQAEYDRLMQLKEEGDGGSNNEELLVEVSNSDKE